MTRLLAGTINPLAFAFLLTAHAILLFADRPLEARGLPRTAPLVIVLDAAERFDLGVRLVREGRADWIHFSSGGGDRMAEIYAGQARPLLPGARITTESRSLTTLQNAYFTMQDLGAIPAGSILVTDAEHLFRAWLCFRWAGSAPLHLAPAADFDLAAAGFRPVLREAVAVWLTLGRIAVFSGLRALGGTPDTAILAARPG